MMLAPELKDDRPCAVTSLLGVADILVHLAEHSDEASYQAGWARDVVEKHGWAAISCLRRVEAHIAAAEAYLDQLRRLEVL